jgi:hypothetical protein
MSETTRQKNGKQRKVVDAPPPPPPGEQYPLEERRKIQIASNNSHVDVDEIRSSDGLFAMISQRRANGVFTIAIFKAFERPGSDRVERTSFIPEALISTYIKLAQLAQERIEKIRAEGTAPFRERQIA